MKAISVFLCGYVGILLEPGETQVWRFKGYKPSVGRKMSCQQLPNPLLDESWETEGIEERLVPLREVNVDENGKYCFSAKSGLWLIKPEISEEE